MTNEIPLWTCRYQEYAPPCYRWWLNVYTSNPPFAHTPMTGALQSEQPEWLQDIVRTAVVGNHMARHDPASISKRIHKGNDVRFVWFRVNEHGALHDFVDPSHVE